MNRSLDASYWDERYREKRMGWDIGYASPPLAHYIDRITDKSKRILIPGAGNSYEAEYLWYRGFKNVTVLDWSKSALKNLKDRLPGFPEEQLRAEDFFTHRGSYDLILEQTFFSALPPGKRPAYVRKMAELLAAEGVLAGVLFSIPLFEDHPPFGGSEAEYRALFAPHLELIKMEPCYNSIPERAGNELFFIARKRK